MARPWLTECRPRPPQPLCTTLCTSWALIVWSSCHRRSRCRPVGGSDGHSVGGVVVEGAPLAPFRERGTPPGHSAGAGRRSRAGTGRSLTVSPFHLDPARRRSPPSKATRNRLDQDVQGDARIRRDESIACPLQCLARLTAKLRGCGIQLLNCSTEAASIEPSPRPGHRPMKSNGPQPPKGSRAEGS